jgi:putative hydrolase
MIYDFHSHTFLSDGVLSTVELIRRAAVKKYSAIGITDHVGAGSLERIINEISMDCELARSHWNILAIPGVELTHVPCKTIDTIARRAKELGAWLVVVHGETPIEPVEPGTNLAAVNSEYVDILAHPGNITKEEADIAAKNGVFLEITARRGHSTANTHVAKIARQSGTMMLVNSDAHDEDDLLSETLIKEILNQAGINSGEFQNIMENDPLKLLQKIRRKP